MMLTAYYAVRAMHILVADADESLRSAITERLQREGFSAVNAVGTGAELLRALAMGLAERHPVDLICVGPDLPDLGGRIAYRELHRVYSASVLAWGTSAEDAEREGMLQAGADDVLHAPVQPAVLCRRAERLLTQRFLARELHRTAARSEMLFLNLLSVMVKVMEAKDPFARFHSENVSAIASATAREMGMPDEEMRRISVAGILHDLGKLGVSESILKKPGPLNHDERQIVERHPLIAATILEPLEQLQGALDYVRFHHERWDGAGYPNQLAGEAIPLGARILHAAEAYATMTTKRAYAAARPREEALAEMERLADAQFDRRVVAAFAVVARRFPVAAPVDETRQRSLAELLAQLSSRATPGPKPVRPPVREH